MKNFCLLVGIYLVCCVSAFAQPKSGTLTPQQDTQRIIRERQRQQQEANRLNLLASQSQAKSSEKREALPFKASRTREQRKRLLPTAQDAAKHTAFLQRPNTGLIKIFTDIGCENNANVVRADAVCLNSIPNSAFYSFREREHTNEYLADLRVKENYFVSDGIFSQGILVSLGDVSLENLSLNGEGMKFLLEFAPKANSGEASKQINQIIGGVRSDGFLYKKTLPITENTTYAMRVVAYRGRYTRVFRGVLYEVLAGDERADLILAFRVLRKSDDGSVTLLWKALQRKESPKIIFPKKNKKSNR